MIIDLLIAYGLYNIAKFQRSNDECEEFGTKGRKGWIKSVNQDMLDKDPIYSDLVAGIQTTAIQQTKSQEEKVNESNAVPKVSLLSRLFRRKQTVASVTKQQEEVKLTLEELQEYFTEKNVQSSIPPYIPLNPQFIVLFYLLSPFTIATCIGKSTIVFNSLAVVMGLNSAFRGQVSMTCFWTSLAAYFSGYPIMYILPFTIILQQQTNAKKIVSLMMTTLFLTFVYLAGLLYASSLLFGDNDAWRFIPSFYGTMFFVKDLQPNIGLYWYFVIEMFEHFRVFFVIVLQMIAFVYVVPMCMTYGQDPLFIVQLLTMVIGFMKSYPSLGDMALWYGMLPMFQKVFPYMPSLGPMLAIQIGIQLIMPVLYGLWMSSGAGNANFFYGCTLMYGMSQVFMIRGMLGAYERRRFDREQVVGRVMKLAVVAH